MNKLLKIKNFIPNYLRAMGDKNTPVTAKILGLVAIAYAILPSDMIPDIIPFLGILDDAIVLPFLIYVTSKMIDSKNINNKENKELS
ncbi:MAG: DUF1232 domain-containing protein [Anaerococcus sp.]|nr:DUF1232 domain-containing protein [Anaerococcus sp.]